MGTIDEFAISEEINIFLRNQNIFTVGQREVTTYSENITMNGSSNTATLAFANVKNIRSISSNGTALTNYQNYTANYEDYYGGTVGTVTFTTTPVANATMAMSYDYGSTDHVHPDFPRADLTLSSYPRTSIEITSVRTVGGAIGGKAHENDLMVSISVFAEKRKNVRTYSKNIRDALLTNNKSFQNFGYIAPLNAGPILKDPNRQDKIEQKTDDYIISHEWEVTA